jgi:small subunit ribosomal protein S6
MTRPDISQAQVDTLIEEVTKQITDAGGNVAKTEYWGLRNIAYRIKKHRKAHYSLLNIEAPAAAMTEVERQLKINEDVLRYLTIRVEELDNEPSVILARREKEEKKAKARAEFAANEFEADEAEEA